ncbi:MAG: O-antigen ligase family protein [Thermodesulfobacteriota bacterium]
MRKKEYRFFLQDPLYAFMYLLILSFSVVLLATPYAKFAVLPAVLVLVLMFIGHYPAFGYYVILFLIPFGAYRGLTGAYKFLTISKFIGIWLVVLVTFHFILSKAGRIKIGSKLWAPLLMFFGAAVVSTLLSEYPETSYDNMRQLFTAYIFFFLTMVLITDKAVRKTLPAVLIWSIGLSSFLSVFGYLFNVSLFTVNIDTQAIKRATGASVDPNLFSAMVIFGLPFMVHRFLYPKSFLEKIIMLPVIGASITAIILTFSRGGGLVLFIILGIIFFENIHRLRPKHLGFYLLMLVVIICAGLFVIPASYWERQGSVTNTADRSIGRRLSYIIVGWDAFKDNPVLGTGPGTYMENYAKSNFSAGYAMGGTQRRFAHNSYLEVLIGVGGLGLILFLSAMVIAFRNYLTARKTFRERGEVELASLIGSYMTAFLAFSLYFLILSTLYHKFFWTAIALSQAVLNFSQNYKGKEPDETPSST